MRQRSRLGREAAQLVGRTFVLPGGVVLQKNSTGDRWSAPNIHGDVMAVTNSTGVKQGSTFTYDPYGQPLNGIPDNTPGTLDYGWVGQHLRPTETGSALGYLEMGVRIYVPWLGRFLQQDPVEGGSANNYEYTAGDPVQSLDLAGSVTCRVDSGSQGGCHGNVVGGDPTWLLRNPQCIGGVHRSPLRNGYIQRLSGCVHLCWF